MNDSLDIPRLEAECRDAAKAGLLHGVTIAAGTRDTLDVLWSWGERSVAPARQPMRADAVFDVASLTKVVATATACGVCIDRGWLDPDAPASAYLPTLGRFADSVIRVRDLATHYSGFDNRKFDQCPPHELVTSAIEAPAQWAARERFEYSCRNYIVLGCMVERVAGETLAEFCERHVFAPLEMSHTRFGPLANGLENVVPTSAPAGEIADEQARRSDRPIGNAGLFSDARDLAIFCQMILNGGTLGPVRVLGEKTLAWLTQPCSPPGLPPRSFGWEMRPCSDCLHRPRTMSSAAIGHGGWTGQSLWIDPALGRYVIVLTNRTHACRDTVATHRPSEAFRARVAEMALSSFGA